MSYKDLQNIKVTLANHGIKVTQQRIVIYQVLRDTNVHPTSEVIFKKIRKKNPSISLGTVYKTLETFVKKGLINRVNTSESHMRYDSRLDDHNHIYCTKTHDILDFTDDKLNKIISNFLDTKSIGNFNLKSFKLHLIGEKIHPDKDIKLN